MRDRSTIVVAFLVTALSTAALSITALSGCGLAPLLGGGVEFTVDQEAYEAGERVTLRLENNTAAEVSYNLCFAQLERKTGDSWQPVDLGKTCTSHSTALKPGKTDTYAEDLPEDLRQGHYRFRVEVRVGGQEKVVVTTGAFDVQ